MKTIKIILRALIVVFAVAILALTLWRKWGAHQNTVTFDYGTISDFSLTDQTGTTITRDSLKGNVWLANFIFTRCQGPCPLISYKTAQLQKEFPSSTGLKFVSFDVDPVFDTPAVLATYAASYQADNARWHFLTGEKKDVYAVIRSSFKLAVEENPKNTPSDADFVHSTTFVIVDKGGVIRGYYNSTDNESFEKLKVDIKKWL